MLDAQCRMRNAQSIHNFECTMPKKSHVRSENFNGNGLTSVAAFGGGIAQGVMDDLAENLHQFIRFLNQRLELRRK